MAQDFFAHDARFQSILGPQPTLELLFENKEYPFAHEAGVYFDSTNELFITSNRFCNVGSQEPRVQITKVVLDKSSAPGTTTCVEIDSSSVPMGNGGANHCEDIMLFCAQGSHELPNGL